MTNICIPKDNFIFLMFLVSGLVAYYNYKSTKETKIYLLYNYKKRKNQIKENSLRDKLKKRDILSTKSMFHPPEKRVSYHNYPENLKPQINIPTRGYPDSYQQLGTLIRKQDEKMLKLFGRRKYPGSNQWEYYVIGMDSSGMDTKMPLKINGDKEISDNEVVNIPWLDNSKGSFQVKIFDNDVPRYNPNVF